MKFGVTLYPYSAFPDLRSLVDFVRLSEELGYDYVHTGEHIAYPKEHERSMGQLWWDPIVLVTHLASVAHKMRFLFGVLVLPLHNPFLLAKSLATLDHVSTGRIEVAFGVGWLEEEFKLLGADFRQRGALTVEYIEVLKALWTSDPASFQGAHLSFSNVSAFPKPLQRPHPPVLIGGNPRTAIPRVIELGTGWAPACSVREFKEGLRVLQQGLIERGQPADDVQIVRNLAFAAPTREMQDHYQHAGTSGRGGFGGDLAKAVQYIRDCQELGVTHLTVNFQADDISATMAQLRSFAEGVIHKDASGVAS